MSDLMDYYFKGVDFGTNYANQLYDRPMQRAANRIKLDGAQMQLEDELILRQARLNNAKAVLDNQGHQNYLQMRIRQGLEPQIFQKEATGIGADIWGNIDRGEQSEQDSRFRRATDGISLEMKRAQIGADTARYGDTQSQAEKNIDFRKRGYNAEFQDYLTGFQAGAATNKSTTYAEQDALETAKATEGQRRLIAGNNANAGVIQSATGVDTATTLGTYARGEREAVTRNADVIGAAAEGRIHTGSHLTTAGVINAEGQVQAAREQQIKTDLIRQVVAQHGTDKEAMAQALYAMTQDPTLTPDEQMVAATTYNEMRLGSGNTDASKIVMIESNPFDLAKSVLGWDLGPMDSQGRYTLYQPGQPTVYITRAGLQAALARSMGVDASPYQKLHEQENSQQSAATYGNTIQQYLPSIGLTPQQTNYITNSALRARGWLYDPTTQQWIDTSGKPIDPMEVETAMTQAIEVAGVR